MERPNINRISSRLRVTVEFHHVDMMQVVHNSQYFKWFEKGRLSIIQRFVSVKWAAARQIAVPVVMNYCEYLAPAVFEDELAVTTHHEFTANWTGRFSFEHSISNVKNKTELCRGKSDVTIMNLVTRRVMKDLPPEVYEKYLELFSTNAY